MQALKTASGDNPLAASGMARRLSSSSHAPADDWATPSRRSASRSDEELDHRRDSDGDADRQHRAHPRADELTVAQGTGDQQNGQDGAHRQVVPKGAPPTRFARRLLGFAHTSMVGTR